jgi:tRNA(Ile)-lysidine synthase
LLDALANARQRLQLAAVWAVGVDHQLRADAAQELALAAALAAQHGVPFFAVAVDVPRCGNRLAAARQARYAALAAQAGRLGATHIATGHTATDQVETLLMHLCRGTGLGGAGGMQARRGMLVRPLLRVSRTEVLAYAAERGLAYALDPSNTDGRRARARIRRDVLPALAALNPRYAAHMVAFCAAARSDEAWLRRRAERLVRRMRDTDGSLLLGPWGLLPVLWRRRVLWLWLRAQGMVVDRDGVRRAMQHLAPDAGLSSGRLSLKGVELIWAQGQLRCVAPPPRGGNAGTAQQRRQSAAPSPCDAPAPTVTWGPFCAPCVLQLGPTRRLVVHTYGVAACGAAAAGGHFVAQQSAQSIADGIQTVAFDADRLHFGLSLRPWRQGDKLQPFGLKGHVKVGDLFTNCKMPRPLRQGWPLVMCGCEVAWVVGLRRSAHAPVTAQTRRIVTLKVEGGSLRAQDGLFFANPGFI